MKKPIVPKFATEAEEAEWWDRHSTAAGRSLVRAIRNGSAHRGGPKALIVARRESARRESKNITIRIATEDIDRARLLATKQGIGYQTYMKILLREALDRKSSHR
jgi:hypothetical protein